MARRLPHLVLVGSLLLGASGCEQKPEIPMSLQLHAEGYLSTSERAITMLRTIQTMDDWIRVEDELDLALREMERHMRQIRARDDKIDRLSTTYEGRIEEAAKAVLAEMFRINDDLDLREQILAREREQESHFRNNARGSRR
ncbi:MAG: hypothetical protein KDA28_02165 [Phycisphaerales bacterium]|nr:hypothetical protein [Phycisphaerales bacterium]